MLKEINLDLATRLINHGPVVLISSMYDKKVNLTPVAWHMPVSKKPPVIALEIGKSHFIYDCIIKSRDFVINVPPKGLVEKVVKCGSCSGRDVDKLLVCGLSTEPSLKIKSPAVGGMLAVMECVLVDAPRVAEEYDIVIGEVKYAAVREEAFQDHWLFEKEEFRTIHHLGDRNFCFPETM
ncbi:MAG: flavin reductase family protein [Candidatus Omnitrophica bacterium]|nr:flavin reductase family protein [Candidatus Omnitrophota bacterium]